MSNRIPKDRKAKPGKRNAPSDTSHLIYGLHAVQAALDAPSSRVLEVWLADARHDLRVKAIAESADRLGLKTHAVEREQLDVLLPDKIHQGCIARCKPLEALGEIELDMLLDDLEPPPLLLILDGVQDPHNLGACLRTAEAAGAHAVIAPRDRASGLTATAIKISSGSAERVPFFQVTNLARVLRELQQRGVWIIGTSGESQQSLYQSKLTGSVAIVLGAEGKGIRRLTREHCDEVVFIPMQGQTESLNVSVAAGVCLYEAYRQRLL